MGMLFSSTIELTCLVLESVNLISNVGFTEVRGRTRQVWTFLGVLGNFSDVLGAILGATRIIFHSLYLIFICFIVLQLCRPCYGYREGETPTIVEVSST